MRRICLDAHAGAAPFFNGRPARLGLLVNSSYGWFSGSSCLTARKL